jgi:hypothetical protein
MVPAGPAGAGGSARCPHGARRDEIVELYFYDELSAGERAEAEAHVAVCAACRDSLADLRAIENALASRRVDEPESTWRVFMARLDERLDALEPSNPTVQPSNPPTRFWKVAASVALVTGGALGGWSLSRLTSDPPVGVVPVRPQIDRAITDAGDAGIERARVVLSGLAQKAQGDEWSLERRMAATLLPEVRLIRQVAADRGRGELADVLIDVETLLLQVSYANADDPETLARLRGMIDRRDLLMRLSAASAADRGVPAAPNADGGL